jgi:uncharacterized protein (TIGR02147 family)
METTPIQINKIADHRDFRLFLQQELMRRCQKNPRYSLRSFAKALNTNPATLSTILAGKRTLTLNTINKMGSQLALSSSEIQAYCSNLQNASKGSKATIDYQQMALDTFTAISEWYHDAILELTHLQFFQPESKWIARVLGVTVNEVNIAIERLCRLKLLHINGESWTDLSQSNQVGTAEIDTSPALRRYQKQILELSLKALEEIPREKRDHTSTTLTLSEKSLPQIKNQIRKFRNELAASIRKSKKDHDQVYQLAVSIFPLTKITKDK